MAEPGFPLDHAVGDFNFIMAARDVVQQALELGIRTFQAGELL